MSDTHSDASTSKSRRDSMTIVVCTHDHSRWPTLERTIRAATGQMRFDDELLVVVDYNDSLLKRCRDNLDGCILIPNRHHRGLSGARNTGLEEAHKPIVAFIDDDAVPLPGWLESLRTPYSDMRVLGVGGLTIPLWLEGQPGWFPEEFLWVVGCSYRGLPDYQHQVRNLIGANMSFRKSVFGHVGGFVETMGRVGGRPLGCEETEFSIRLTQAAPSAILLYHPAAQVEHYIPRQRSRLRYFVRRCWAEGVSKAEVSRRVGSSDALSTERNYVLRVLPKGFWQGLHDAATGDIQGVARSIAILLGVVVTAAAYFVTTPGRPSEHVGGAT
jgi:glucosyl-dolichyl phosphate glucuronosyltransferase